MATPDLSTVLGRAAYFTSAWIESIAFSISLIVIVLVAVYHLRRRFPKSRLYTLLLILAGSSLFVYLLEGYISPLLGRWLFGAGWYITDFSGHLLLPSILLQIIAITAVAYFLHRGYNIFISKAGSQN